MSIPSEHLATLPSAEPVKREKLHDIKLRITFHASRRYQMKSLFLFSCFVFLSFFITSGAFGYETIRLTGGSELTVPVMLTEEKTIESFDITIIGYDPAIAEVRDITFAGGILEGSNYVLTHSAEDSIVISIYAMTDLITGSGDIVLIHFDVKEKGFAGLSLVKFECNESLVSGGFSVNDTITQSFQILINRPPAAIDAVLETDEDTALKGKLFAFDAEEDALSYTIVTGPARGTVEITDAETGEFTYTPDENEGGTETFTWQANDGLSDSEIVSILIQIDPVNDPPRFIDARDMEIYEDDDYTYLAEAHDPDAGDVLTIRAHVLPHWMTLTDNGDGTALLKGSPGDNDIRYHMVELEVADAAGETDMVSFRIGVTNINDVPAFADTPPANAAEDEVYTCTVITADPDFGDTRVITAPTLPAWLTLTDNGDGTATLTGTPTNEETGDHEVVLEVEDLAGDKALQAFTITVGNVNDTPFFTSMPPTDATQDAVYTYSIIAADSDPGDSLTITAMTLPAWLTFTDNGDGTAVLSGTPGNIHVGEHPVELKTEDSQAGTDSQSFTILVANINDAPAFTSTPVTDVEENAVYTYHLVADDPDTDDTVTITAPNIPAWLTLTDNGDGTGILTGTPASTDLGNHDVSLQVKDEAGETHAQVFTISVGNVNETPAFTSAAVTAATEDAEYVYEITASDPDEGDSLRITAPILPEWLSFTDNGSGTAIIKGMPGNPDVGNYQVRLRVRDAGGLRASQDFLITVANVNDAPLLDNTESMNFQTINEDVADFDNTGTRVTDILASNSVADPLTDVDADAAEGIAVSGADTVNGLWQYDDNRNGSFSDFPGDISEQTALLLNDTAVIRFVPHVHFNGTAEIRFRAWDRTGHNNGDTTVNGGTTPFSTAIGTVVITVDPVNDAPQISGSPLLTVNEDELYSFIPEARDTDGDELTFSVLNLPVWAEFDPDMGKLGGTPANDDVGIHVGILISISDGMETTELPAFDVTVININDSPVISGTPPTSISEDNTYTFTPTVEDPDEGDTLTFSVVNPPDWADFDTATGELSGTPGNDDVKVSPGIIISVTDGLETVELPGFDILVKNINDLPIISGIPPISVNEDSEYSFIPIAEDSDAEDTLSFSIQNKPGWADFDTATGELSGTPDNEDAGIYERIVIYVTDGTETVSLPLFDITVLNINDAPLISGTPMTRLDEDTPYSFVPEAGDHDPEDTLTFSIENKPGWAEFNTATGELSGTPSDDGVGTVSNILIRVSDGSETASLPVFDITVSDVNDAPIITGQNDLGTDAGTGLTITPADLIVTDPDNIFPGDFMLTVHDGEHYTRDADTVTPEAGFLGILTVPVSISDGKDDSEVFDLSINVTGSDVPDDPDTPVTDSLRQISGTIKGLDPDNEVQVRVFSQSEELVRTLYFIGTGENIEYTFTDLKPAYDYRAEIISTDYAWQIYNGKTDANEADILDLSEEDATDIDFTMIPAEAIISGQVIFPEIASPGDEVRVHAFSSSTGKEAEISVTLQAADTPGVPFELTGLLPAKDYLVSVRSDKYKTRYYDAAAEENASPVDTDSPEARQVDFALEPGAVISGRISGENLTGTYVEVWSDSLGSGKGVTVSQDGSYIIEGLEDADDYKLKIVKPDMAPFYFDEQGNIVRDSGLSDSVSTGDGESPADSIVTEGETVSGAIRDENGDPLAGIWVEAWSESQQTGYGGVYSGADGTYELKGLDPEETYTIIARPDPSLPYTSEEGFAIVADGSSRDFKLSSREAYKIRGKISDENGALIPDAKVEIWSDSQDFYEWSTTDIFGVYEIPGLPPSEDYMIQVTPPEDSPYAVSIEKDIFINSDTVTDITLEPGRQISGTIQVNENESLEEVQVIIFSEEMDFRIEASLDKDGAYHFTNLPDASDYVITVFSESHTYLERTVLPGQLEVDIISLESGGTISGEVKDNSTGEVLAGVLVEAYSESSGNVLNYSGSAVTDEQGRYAIRGLKKESLDGIPLNDYEVDVNVANYSSQPEYGRASEDTVSFSLDLGGSISGVIEDFNPDIFQDAVIDIFENQGNLIRTEHVGEDGNFEIRGLGVGLAYQLKFIAFLTDGTTLTQWAGDGDIGFDDPDAGDNPSQAAVYETGTVINFRFDPTSSSRKKQASLSGNARSDTGESLNLSSPDSGMVSSDPEVTVKWESSSDDPGERYYYLFDRDSGIEITKRTAPRTRPVRSRRASSTRLEGDNVAYYFHVAPVNERGRIGDTAHIAFRIDTVPPYNTSVTASPFTLNRNIILTLGATGASEMYISNISYGEGGKWEKMAKTREWTLTRVEGKKTIYVQFRDRAGNTSDAVTVTERVTSMPDQYRITAVAGENGNIIPSGELMVYTGDDVMFSVTPDDGYETDKVFVNGEPSEVTDENIYTLRNITGDASIAVTFKEKSVATYTITALAEANGSISPFCNVPVREGEEIIFTITPDPGYVVDKVLVDGKTMGLKDDNTFQFINVHKDYTMIVTFVICP
ncbi:putative Ig domain-containing protein [Desulfococcaceae bacterium HSG8]|nr:putative Ig domain-containing protein [Desulfococcaceae bacterium HSG8]